MEKQRDQFLFELYNELSQDKMSLFYLGKFDDELTEMILQIQESSSYGDHSFRKIEKKAGYLMAECFQNVIRHGIHPNAEEAATTHQNYFLIRSLPKYFHVTSGNLVTRDGRVQLEKILGRIMETSLPDLRKIYLEILSSGEVSAQGGAGLGLIDIARKTGKNLFHHFETINEYESLFLLQIVIDIFQIPDEYYTADDHLIKSLGWYKKLKSDGYMLLFKGDFSHESLLTILNMFEGNLIENKNKNLQKKSYYIALEMLQNMSKHAESQMQIGKPGIFGIGYTENGYFLESGNFIHQKNKVALENFLKYLNQSSKQDLDNLYRKILVEKEPGFKGSAGLGFIDICRMSQQAIEYSFSTVDDEYWFFEMRVRP